ncbi:BrnT family toxin [Thiofilum flexile]|uniref:BrnT family toxin n=1 Tax=Thiofilum flexile TaxID=125627 RepID=UPI00037883F3|nr:BrnT family toxin [Thiofilum flexile]
MFEWDEDKNQSNIAKHGISFDLAKRIFEGPVFTFLDTRDDYGEDREISIGMVEGILILTVVHTEREDGIIRLISARRATQAERKRYENYL